MFAGLAMPPDLRLILFSHTSRGKSIGKIQLYNSLQSVDFPRNMPYTGIVRLRKEVSKMKKTCYYTKSAAGKTSLFEIEKDLETGQRLAYPASLDTLIEVSKFSPEEQETLRLSGEKFEIEV